MKVQLRVIRFLQFGREEAEVGALRKAGGGHVHGGRNVSGIRQEADGSESETEAGDDVTKCLCSSVFSRSGGSSSELTSLHNNTHKTTGVLRV